MKARPHCHAERTRAGAGLTSAKLNDYQCLDDAGYVVGQFPEGNTRLRRGTAVILNVSTGTEANGQSCPRR